MARAAVWDTTGTSTHPKTNKARRKAHSMAPKRSGIEPCKACRYPTRTARQTLAHAPGTRKRLRGLCQPCAEKERPRPKPDPAKTMTVREQRALQEIEDNPPDPAILASLNKFMQARNNRLARLQRMHT